LWPGRSRNSAVAAARVKTVALSLFDDFTNGSDLTLAGHHQQTLERLLDQVISWSQALQTLRTGPALAT